MNKPQFQTKLKELRKPNERLCDLYKRIAEKTGFAPVTVERANGNGKIDASKRFYQVFKMKYGK